MQCSVAANNNQLQVSQVFPVIADQLFCHQIRVTRLVGLVHMMLRKIRRNQGNQPRHLFNEPCVARVLINDKFPNNRNDDQLPKNSLLTCYQKLCNYCSDLTLKAL